MQFASRFGLQKGKRKNAATASGSVCLHHVISADSLIANILFRDGKRFKEKSAFAFFCSILQSCVGGPENFGMLGGTLDLEMWRACGLTLKTENMVDLDLESRPLIRK